MHLERYIENIVVGTDLSPSGYPLKFPGSQVPLQMVAPGMCSSK